MRLTTAMLFLVVPAALAARQSGARIYPNACQVLESSPWASIKDHLPEDRQ